MGTVTNSKCMCVCVWCVKALGDLILTVSGYYYTAVDR